MNKKIKAEKSIKAKVFVSYAVIIILISSLLYFTFGSFQKLTQSTDSLAQPNLRIGLLHDIMFSIYNAESNIRSYTLNEQEEHLDAYFEDLSNINSMVDSLYNLAGSDTIFSQVIDSINVQLLRKTRILDQLIKLKKLEQNAVLYERALDKIIEVAKEETRVKEITHQTIVDDIPVGSGSAHTYTLEEINREKENFFTRIRTFFSRKQHDTPTLEESKITRELNQAQQIIQKIRTDTIITVYRDIDNLKEDIEHTMVNLMHSILDKQRSLMKKENHILMEDKKVMDMIWDYITYLEMYETENALRQAQSAHETVNTTTRKIFIAVVSSMLVLLVFSWLFVNDMNKSKYYKKQLISERAKAEQLLQVKQRFMANISHEIRTPLNSIIGFSNQLDKIHLDEKYKTYIKAINQSSLHLLGIVNDILDFSKIEAGKVNIEKIPVDLREIATEVKNTLSFMSMEKKIDFILETNALQYPYVLADPLCIKQVLLNIAGNAVKFTSSGYVRMSLTDHVQKDRTDTTTVRIRISDTGPGIAYTDQKKIFDEFAQADNQATRKHGGTGLGLSISKKLVELMNGSIELYSQPGKGSTFSVYLPLEITEKNKISQTVDVQIDHDLNAKMLLVDDDKLNRLLIGAIVSQYKNIVLHEAEDAIQGIEMLKKQKYDLILTDIQMPEMSGIEMIKKLRSGEIGDSQNQNIPVIACTADITSDTLKDIQNSGINDYLLKPFNESLFLRKISEHTNGKVSLSSDYNKTDVLNDEDPAERLYNLDNLKAFTGKDSKALTAIVTAFVEDTRLNLIKLKNSHKSNDLEGVSLTSHKMSNMFALLQSEKATLHLKILSHAREGSLSKTDIQQRIEIIEELSHSIIAELSNDEQIKDLEFQNLTDN